MKNAVLFESIYNLAGRLEKANGDFRDIWIPRKSKSSTVRGEHNRRDIQLLGLK